jgi:hypothetical protein
VQEKPLPEPGVADKGKKVNIMDIVHIIPDYISAIGSLLTGIVTLITLQKVKHIIPLKDEILYGKEAKHGYESIKKTLPIAPPYCWGPVEWQGGETITLPIFEVKRIVYDPETMGAEWEGCKKSVRYVYEDGNKIMVRGWRIK